MEGKQTWTWDDCPEWFQEEPDWTPWSTGKQSLLHLFQTWNRKCGPNVRDNQSHELHDSDTLAIRMLSCLVYRQSALRETSANVNVQTESSPQTFSMEPSDPIPTIGHPFAELILTDAFASCQHRAYEAYELAYRDALVGTAYRIDPSNRCDRDKLPEWWSDFYLYLVDGKASEKKRIETFLGISSLKTWICQTLWFYMLTEKRKETKRVEREGTNETDMTCTEDTDFALQQFPDERGVPLAPEIGAEWLSAYRASIEVALQQLETEEKLRISLRLQQPNKWIGEVIFHEPEHMTTRKYQAAMAKLTKIFWTHMKGCLSPGLVESLETITQERFYRLFTHHPEMIREEMSND